MKRWQSLVLVIVILAAMGGAQQSPSAKAFDVIILNGKIIDGSGNPWYSGDIGIRNDRIDAIGKLRRAGKKNH